MIIVTDREFEEMLHHLQHLLRMDTTNPPGREAAVTRYVAGVLGVEGIPSVVVMPPDQQERASLVARISVHRPDEALILSAHADVRPAPETGWTHPPFEGRVADGWLWGRGALEGKREVAFGLMALVLAKRYGLPLSRDLVLAICADGIVDGERGARLLALDRPDLLRGRWVLSGNGGIPFRLGSRILVPVRTATKGFAFVRLTAFGDSGRSHPARPTSAIFNLAEALRHIRSGLLDSRWCPAAAAFVDGVASALPASRAATLHGLKLGGITTGLGRVIPDKETADRVTHATHDTVVPTLLRAGAGETWSPDRAVAVLDLRILPGLPVQDAIMSLESRLGDGIEVEVLSAAEAVETPAASPLWDAIAAALKQTLPDARPVPWVDGGGPEASAWAHLGLSTIGFSPVFPDPETPMPAAGGENERVPLAGLRAGFQTFLETVVSFSTRENLTPGKRSV
jgi:acetylornithine deacetylase/succinyl-diaminopimelate desuccinylase-like protein